MCLLPSMLELLRLIRGIELAVSAKEGRTNGSSRARLGGHERQSWGCGRVVRQDRRQEERERAASRKRARRSYDSSWDEGGEQFVSEEQTRAGLGGVEVTVKDDVSWGDVVKTHEWAKQAIA